MKLKFTFIAILAMLSSFAFTANAQVAKIGETPYATLQAAIEAVQEGDEIVLLADVEQADGIIITDKKITIDLGGKTFKVTEGASTNNRNLKINGSSVVTIKNGTMVAGGNYSSGAYGTIRTEGTANVTLTGLKLYNYRGNGLNIKACSGTSVTVENTEIYANYGGGIEAAGGTIVVNNVTVKQQGMYTAPYNSMAISVNGGGKVTVNSGTYSTECITAEEANGQGSSHGPWVAGVLNSGGTLIINGGTFSNDNFGDNSLATAARGAILADTGAKIEIRGGTFNALKSVIDIQNNLGDASKNPTGAITGGTFSADPTNGYVVLAEGCKVVENANGTFGVEKAAAYVAKIGEQGYETLSAAFAAVTDDTQTVVVLQDVTEELTGAYLRGNITTENGAKVTIKLTNSGWVYCPYTFVLGENITLNVPYLFYYAGGAQINGTVVAGAYYQSNAGTKFTINEPGSMTVTSETCIIRYMEGDPNAGIYVVGDNNNKTVGLKIVAAYFYQGMIYAKDANIKTAVYWQTNETDGQGSANLVLDNSTLNVTGSELDAKATGNSTVTLTNGSSVVIAGGFVTDAELSIDATSYIQYRGGKIEGEAGLSGNGTETSPYLINNVNDLVLFRNSVNAGETKYSAPGVWVALAADIDLADENWVGIGSATAEHGFMGNFDGKTFKIKNLTITDPALDSDGYAYAGLFAVTEGTDKNNQNVIKNLTIENVTINTTGHIVSAAIAYPYYTIVDNVKVCGDIAINGGDYTAGVLAYTRRCMNASNLTVSGEENSYIKGNITVGGVISDIQTNGGEANYSNFCAEGITVTGKKSVGGISGIIAAQTLNGATVKNVTLNSEDGHAGVVSGRLGGASTITGVVAENVTGATAFIGATYDAPKAVQAKMGDTYYATLEAAFAAAQNGEDVELIAATYEGIVIPAEFTGKLVINSDVVVNNANGSAITGENINISGTGTLTAIANGDHAYGIGGDNTESINIENVRILKVQGGRYGEIGTDTKYYKDAPDGGAAIGSGNNGAIINLTNVTIDEALGGSKAAGIGARYWTGVIININGCTIKKVEGGATAAGIGGSRVSSDATESEAVTINIKNSTIEEAKGGAYAAGIGSGYDTHCQANQPICTINIDGSTINAQGGKYAAGIGTGYHNAGLAGEIKNSTITAASGDKVYKDSYTSAQDIGFGVADLAREGSNNDSYIVYNGTMIALPGTGVAKIGEQGYATLQAAFDAVKDGETITLIDNVTVSKATAAYDDGTYIDGVRYTGDKSFTVDFNGKTVTDDGCVNDYLIYINNKGEKASEITFTNGTIVSANGCWSAVCVNSGAATQNVVLNLNGMNITNSNDAEYSGNPVVRVRTLATVNVNDGTIITSNGASYGVAANTDGSTLNINEGATIVQQNSGTTGGNSVFAAVGGKGVINIKGGTITSDKFGVHTMTTGTPVINISGGTITAPVALKSSTNGGNGELATINVTGGTINGALDTYTENGKIVVSGGTFSEAVVQEYCAEGYAVAKAGDVYIVGQLPNADVINLGNVTVGPDEEGVYNTDSYYVYDLVGGNGLSSATEPFDLQIAMNFKAKDTAEEAAANAFGNYTTDFFITMTGINGGEFVADGCFLAGYYPSFNAWVKIPLNGFTVEDGKVYPVITSAGFDFKYTDICGEVKDFICGIYLTPEVLATNPDLKVELSLGLSEDMDAALATKFMKVDSYVYDAEQLAPAVAQIGETKYNTLQAAIEAAQAGETITMLCDVELASAVTIPAGKVVTLDLNGKTVSYTSAVVGEDMITNNGNLTITDSSDAKTGKITYNNTDTTGKNVTISTISACPGSTLVVNGGTIENTSVGVSSNVNVAYTIDILTNGSLGDVAVTINGGSVVSINYIAIRQFNNGTACKNSLTINDGHIYGAKRAVQVHMDNNAAVTAINGGKVEAGEGGYALCNFAATSTLEVTGGELIGAVYSASEGFITGGTFSEEPYSGYIAEHYEAVPGDNGYYGIKVEEGYIATLEIIDGEYGNYTYNSEKTVGKLTYVRTLPAAGIWYSVFLPFDVPVEALGDGFDVARINDLHTNFNEEDGSIEKMWIEYIVKKSGTLPAGKPFLVRAKSSDNLDMVIELKDVTLYAANKKTSIIVSSVITKITFEGVYELLGAPASTSSTRYMAVNADGVWDEFDGYSLNPFRVMMTLEILEEEYYIESAASLSVGARVIGEENEDGTTVIYDVYDEAAEDMIFDLQGRRVLETEKGGIYIKGGKKFIAQ